MPQKDWLRYYSRRFPTVEINNSFYIQPKDKSWDSWRETAPEGFCYAVKAHQYITHLKRLRDCEDSLDRVITSARRLGPHLGPLLFQLPPNFKRTNDTAARLESFLELLPTQAQCAFEFRDKSWFVDETLDRLRHRDAAFCCFDSPRRKSPLVTTASFAYMRFHGASAARGGNYSRSSLENWAERLRGLARGLDDIYVYFNNDAFGHAVRNAMTLTELIAAAAPGGTIVAAKT